MKKLDKQQAIAEHNARYEVMVERRKVATRYVNLLKAPKTNGNETA